MRDDDQVSYKRYSSAAELERLVAEDLALLLSERFGASGPAGSEDRSDDRAGAPLPLPPTPTFGRAQLVRSVLERIDAGARCVTLTGPGGVGKTRLAVEVARARAEAEPAREVHVVSLAPVDDPELALRTVAEALGAWVEGTRSLVRTLIDHLEARRTLLVLDNLEQVLGIGPALAEVLAHCPGLVALVTSRQALGLRVEQEVAVEPLGIGEGTALGPAVELFLERASAAGRGATAMGDDLPAVVELCRRLDGLPLAIEPAAARARLVPPRTMLARLEDGHDLPPAPGGDRPTRQRTLRATLEWSHDLLTEPERRAFAAFGAFEGGATLEAAEEVCGGAGEAVLDALLSLADKSLLRVEPDPHGQPRLSMLETVRAFARERLEASPEREAVRRRHLDLFLTLAWVAHPHLCGPGQRAWAARLDPERADLRRAVRTALELDDPAAVVGLSWGVYVYFWIRDAEAEPGAWLEAAARSARALDPIVEAELRSLLALNRNARGDFSRAEEDLAWALEVFRREGMDFMAAVALKELATARFVADETPDRAVVALEESSRLFDRVDHDWGVALSETLLGTVLATSGDLAAAERHHLRSLERARAIDSDQLIIQGLHQLALVRLLEGRPDDAVALLAEAVPLVVREHFQVPAAYCLDVLGGVAVRTGQPGVGAEALHVADAVRTRLGAPLWPTLALLVASFSADAEAALDPAHREAAREAAGASTDPFTALGTLLDRLDASAVADRAGLPVGESAP